MNTSKILCLFILIFSFSCIAQQRVKATFGEPTYSEREMTSYDKDQEAAAVVLFESGKNHVEVINSRYRLVKEVHRKIKVFNPSKFEHGEVEIHYYKSEKTKEKIAVLSLLVEMRFHDSLGKCQF